MIQPKSRWRLVVWPGLFALLVIPLIAMQFTSEVVWDRADFVLAAIMLAGLGLAFEILIRTTHKTATRVLFGAAIVTAFLLIWAEAAVGLIGA